MNSFTHQFLRIFIWLLFFFSLLSFSEFHLVLIFFKLLFLQVVENILLSKFWVYFLFEATTNKICQFVGIPTWSRYTDSSWPIVVQVRQLVRKDLNFIWRPTGLVQNNVVRCRVDSSLTHRLADEVKIVPVVKMGKK